VLIPRLGGTNMQRILAVFRGEAPLAGSTPTTIGTATTLTPSTGEVVPDENTKGVVPPRDVEC
jgi:hypothetical protein